MAYRLCVALPRRIKGFESLFLLSKTLINKMEIEEKPSLKVATPTKFNVTLNLKLECLSFDSYKISKFYSVQQNKESEFSSVTYGNSIYYTNTDGADKCIEKLLLESLKQGISILFQNLTGREIGLTPAEPEQTEKFKTTRLSFKLPPFPGLK